MRTVIVIAAIVSSVIPAIAADDWSAYQPQNQALLAEETSSAAQCDGLIVTGAQYGYGAQWGLYKVAEDGQGLEQVIRGGAYARYAPDRESFVFARGGNLWLHTADGRNRPWSLGELNWPDAQHFAWAPDGSALYLPLLWAPLGDLTTSSALSRVALSAFRDNAPFGHSETRLKAPGRDFAYPAVSVTGVLAVCAVNRVPRAGITSAHVLLRGNGGEWGRITSLEDRYLELRPTFSHDGQEMAFDVVDRETGTQQAYIFHLADERLVRIVLPDSVPDFLRNTWALQWQPGRRVLAIGWGRFVGGHSLPTRLGLWASGDLTAIGSSTSSVRDVAWSPSGEHLAVIRERANRAPGASARLNGGIMVHTIDLLGEASRSDLIYRVSWADHMSEFLRWDPVVPVDLEW